MELEKRQISLTGAFQLPVKMRTTSKGVRRVMIGVARQMLAVPNYCNGDVGSRG